MRSRMFLSARCSMPVILLSMWPGASAASPGQVSPCEVSTPRMPASDPEATRAGKPWAVFGEIDPDYSYRLEYPSGWAVSRSGTAVLFTPPAIRSPRDHISITIIDYRATPPPPGFYRYITVRTLQRDVTTIAIQRREPSPVNESYRAELRAGEFAAEFRSFLGGQYDAIFDHMLSSFEFTVTR